MSQGSSSAERAPGSAGRSDGRSLLDWLRGRTGEMTDLLCRLAGAESPSLDPEAQREARAILEGELSGLGLSVELLPGGEGGDHLLATAPNGDDSEPIQLLLGHLDTVWPVGTLATMPVRIGDGLLYGPGVFDMKAGLVQMIFALRVLAEQGIDPACRPVVLVSADEEVGSRDSRRHIERLAREAARVLVLEPAYGPAGKLKTARKGVGSFTLKVQGVASHAGLDPETGVSAILELSHQVQRLFGLNDADRGITVNVGTIDGGLRPNVIAPEAMARIEARVVDAEDAAWIDGQIRGLTPIAEGVSLQVEGGFGRPPLQRTPRNRALWQLALDAAAELGIEIDEALAGGASDGNVTSAFAATLDGLGAVGDGAHAEHEHVIVERMPERAALVAMLLATPLSTRAP
jgi:glutamate carboxypeptidase